MSNAPDNIDLVEQMLNEEMSFKKASDHFDSDVDCYKSLRDTAKTSLSSFEEYIGFYRRCIDQGPTDFVYGDLNKNAVRSIKNMTLQDSSAGKQYPIHSIEELIDRIKKYQQLNVKNVTEKAVISAILEHIYENHDDYIYEILDSLLAPSEEIDPAGTLLVRARFIEATDSTDPETNAFAKYKTEFVNDLPDPRPDDTRSADELWTVSQQMPYKEVEKVELAQSSLVSEFNYDRFYEYLYLSARDVVERYRHSNRAEPQRGELQLAKRQMETLQKLSFHNNSTEEMVRLDSYEKVVAGQLKSGNWWHSQQDVATRPDPNFYKAAASFYQAAVIIRPVNKERYIKYLSKSVRYQAKASEIDYRGPIGGLKTGYQLHELMENTTTKFVDDSAENIQNVIEETGSLHRCLKHQTAAKIACYRGEPENIRHHVDQAFETLRNNKVPVYIDHGFLKDMKRLAEGYTHEERGNITQAIRCYKEVDISDNEIPIRQRQNLAILKQAIEENENTSALEIAETEFAENAPIKTAVGIIFDGPIQSPQLDSSELDRIVGSSAKDVWTFRMFVHLVGQTEEPSQAMQTQIESMLMQL